MLIALAKGCRHVSGWWQEVWFLNGAVTHIGQQVEAASVVEYCQLETELTWTNCFTVTLYCLSVGAC